MGARGSRCCIMPHHGNNIWLWIGPPTKNDGARWSITGVHVDEVETFPVPALMQKRAEIEN